ncbi:hypothetical protein C5167_034148 [Papaver somniferum]|uniref:Translation elongation factor EFTu-like domain-containing protein n=1 Tax=Papaver somniferum TaxID=3469 RepID=A0A4Y7KGD2_PAPSO|nr:hypothetical protein C5167_034148 [Papaver somniferum]
MTACSLYYFRRILTSRIISGVLHVGNGVHGLGITDSGDEKFEEGKVTKLMKKKGTSMVLVDGAGAGDIVSITGLATPSIAPTVASVEDTLLLKSNFFMFSCAFGSSATVSDSSRHVDEDHVIACRGSRPWILDFPEAVAYK